MPASNPYRALLIPDISVGTDQNTKFVLVLKADDTVEMRSVKIGKLFGKMRAITDGLKLGEKVIVNGMQLAKPGAKVKATEIPIPEEQVNDLRKLYAPSVLLASSRIPVTPPSRGEKS